MNKAIRYGLVCLCVLIPILLLAQEPKEKVRMQWTRLGADAQIDNDFFSHVFRLRKNAGAFSKLELRINGIFFLDLIIVQYEDGKSWSPKEYPTFAIRTSYLVVLPDSEKNIKTVEIRYHDVGGPINKAAVSLWGGRAKKPKG
jgi:hypothetical protein